MIKFISFILVLWAQPALGIELGHGRTGENWVPRCVEGEKVYGGIHQCEIHFDYGFKSSEEVLSLFTKVSGGVDVGIFGMSGETNLNSVIRQGNKDWYFVSEFEIKGRSEQLESVQWSEFGKEVLKLKDDRAFKNLCGDKYVSQLARRKRIYLVLRYRFKGVHQRHHLKVKVKVKTILGSVSRTYHTKLESNSGLDKVSVYFAGQGLDLTSYVQPIEETMKRCNKDNISSCDRAANMFHQLLTSKNFGQVLSQPGGVSEQFYYGNYSTLPKLNEELHP